MIEIPQLTTEQIAEEIRYRIEERLGILAGTTEPTIQQLEIARSEALAWKQEYLKTIQAQD